MKSGAIFKSKDKKKHGTTNPSTSGLTYRPIIAKSSGKSTPKPKEQPLRIITVTPRKSTVKSTNEAKKTSKPLKSSTAKPKIAICQVCRRLNCTLRSHKAFISAIVAANQEAEKSISSSSSDDSPRFRDELFTKSYAYFWAQQFIDPDIAADQFDPFHKLPLPDELNNGEMHGLFHRYFTVEIFASFDIPRPTDIPLELITSPFLIPAMQNKSLCLAVVTCCKITATNRGGQNPKTDIVYALLSNTVQALREQDTFDKKEPSDSSIIAAVWLWALNVVLEDPSAMAVYERNVSHMLKARGGLKALGMTGADNFIRWARLMHCIVFEESPDEDSEDTSPINQSKPPDIWRCPRAAAVMSPELAAACYETCHILEIVDKALITGIKAAEYFLILGKYRNLITRNSASRSIYKNSPTIDKCVLHALDIIAMTAVQTPCDVRLLTKMSAVRLGRTIHIIIKANSPKFWEDKLDLLCWLMFAFALIPSEFYKQKQNSDLLRKIMIKQLGPKPWSSDWKEQIKKLLLHFVWSDIRFSKSFDDTCTIFLDDFDYQAILKKKIP